MEYTRGHFIELAACGLLTALFGFRESAVAQADQIGFDDRANGLPEYESVNARFNRIFNTYDVGDVLSPEDAVFIEQHAAEAYSQRGLARETWTLSASRTFNGHTYYLNGNKYGNNIEGITYSYGATIQGGCPTTLCNAITVVMNVVVYGFTGSSYEVVHKDQQSNTGTNRNWFTSEFTGIYGGMFTDAYISCYASITDTTGQTFVVQ